RPDVHALIRREIELVARLHVERLVPGVDVPDDAVDAIFLRAVRVGKELRAQRPLARLALPALGVGDEEALVAGIAVDHRRLAVAGDVAAVGRVSRFQTAEIAEILAEGQLAL